MKENKDKNTTNNQEFRLDLKSKLFLVVFGIALIGVFVLFYNNASKKYKPENPPVAVEEQDEKDNNNKVENNKPDKEKPDEEKKDNSADKGKNKITDRLDNDNLKLALNIFGRIFMKQDIEIDESMFYDLEEEESYIYFNDNIYEWVPSYKVFSETSTSDLGVYSNTFGKIPLRIESVSFTPDELEEGDLEMMEEDGYVGIYNSQLSEDYISHVEIVSDDVLILTATSKQEFDSFVYVKHGMDMSKDEDVVLDKDTADELDIYFAKSAIDKNFKERVGGLSPVNSESLGEGDIVWIEDVDKLSESLKDVSEKDINENGYVFVKSHYDDHLFKAFYGVYVKDNLIVVDLFKALEEVNKSNKEE